MGLGLVDGSQIEYYSDEFNELCPELGAGPIAAENPLGQGAKKSKVGAGTGRGTGCRFAEMSTLVFLLVLR